MKHTIVITRYSFVALMLLLTACGGGSSGGGGAAPPQPSTVLEIVQRDATGALTGVAGIEVLRNDATTGAYIGSKITDVAGRADFGALAGPVTLSIVRTPPASGGPTRAYTLLGLPEGNTRVRLDRLLLEPATVRATVNVALAPALSSTERAHVCLPGDCVGDASMASPGAAAFSNVPITDHDIQDDGLVTLVAEVQDAEMGTTTGCRPYIDFAVPASGVTLAAPASPSVLPGTITTSGALGMRRVLALRKGVMFPLYAWETKPTCAFAFSSGIPGGSPGAITGTTGFSLQGAVSVGGGTQQVPNYYKEQWTSEKRGALWVNGPTLPVVPQTIPAADATIAALSYDTGTLHFTLKGTEVRPLVAARARIVWSPTGATDIRVWYLYSGLAVKPASCDGTSADPDCSFAVKLPDLSAMGTPPNQINGTQISLEAVAPTGAAMAADFWRELAAEGDAESVLARGYSGAYRESALWKLNFTLSTGDYITNSANYNLGKVTGPNGIDCGGPLHPYYTLSCDATMPGGTQVTLTAIPNSGAEFVGWVGLCASSTAPGNTSVTFVLDKDQSCTPKFRSLGGASYGLTVAVITPAGNIQFYDTLIGTTVIYCGRDAQGFIQSQCWANFGSGSAVTLTATKTDNLNAYDIVWGGDCTGTTGPTALLVMDAAKNCSVDFKIKL
jgi:hypothetical protein